MLVTLWKRLRDQYERSAHARQRAPRSRRKSHRVDAVADRDGNLSERRRARADAAAPQPTPEINAINTAWTLIAAFLVFGTGRVRHARGGASRGRASRSTSSSKASSTPASAA